MSLQSRIADLITAVAADTKQLRIWVTGSSTGDLTTLTTTTKTSLLAALNEVTARVENTDAVIRYPGIGSIPLRSTVTSNTTTRSVRWRSPDAPTIGGGYAIAGLDVWEKTA